MLLAGGVINSPQLLMLSGIGDPAELGAHSIDVRAPAVRRRQEPARSHQRQRRIPPARRPARFAETCGLIASSVELAKAVAFGTGFACDLPSGWTAFIKSRPDAELPDIQLIFRAIPLGAGPYLPPFKPAFADGFGCRAILLRPKEPGRNQIELKRPSHAAAYLSKLLCRGRRSEDIARRH